MNEYAVERGVVRSEAGLPWMPRLFCDDQLMFEVNENMITEIRYYHPNMSPKTIFLRKNFWKPLAFYMNNGSKYCGFRPVNVQVYPCGFCADWMVESVRFGFSLVAVHNSILLTVATPENLPEGHRFAIELHKSAFFNPHTPYGRDFDSANLCGPRRQWEEPAYQDGAFRAAFSWDKAPGAAMCMTSDIDMTLRQTARFTKYVLSTSALGAGRRYHFAFSFGGSQQEADENSAFTLGHAEQLLAQQKERYDRVASLAPRYHTGNEELDAFMALAPMYNESLKYANAPGGLRANTKHYMAWGSDSLYHGYSLAAWGDNEYNRDILALAKELGSPLICAYDAGCTRNVHRTNEAFSMNDGVYLTHLYSYMVGGGSVTEEQYAYAKALFHWIATLENPSTGLFLTGNKQHFDFSGDSEYTCSADDSYGVKENGLMYMAVRCMQHLAYEHGDLETAQQAASLAARFEKHFCEICFDDEAGFFPIFTNSKTGQHAKSYCAYLMMYENDFMTDAMEETFQDSVAYFRKHFITENGILSLDREHPAYDLDANQMHCWWPAYNADYYSRIIAMTDATDLVDQYVRWITYWSSRLTMPEGYELYDDHPDPGFDEWNQHCGAWQMFTYRAFYQSILRSVIGIDFDHAGVTVYPYHSAEMSVEGVHMLGSVFDVRVCGTGKYIERLNVNGTELVGTHRVPFDLLSDHNTITAFRTEAQSCPIELISCNGAYITGYSAFTDGIAFTIEPQGHAVLKLQSQQAVKVEMDSGEKWIVQPDPRGRMKLEMTQAGRVTIGAAMDQVIAAGE